MSVRGDSPSRASPREGTRGGCPPCPLVRTASMTRKGGSAHRHQVKASPLGTGTTRMRCSEEFRSPEFCGPSGIRTRDLHLERVASLAARRWGLVAGVPGFEPGLAEPESAGLPGYPTPQGTAAW